MTVANAITIKTDHRQEIIKLIKQAAYSQGIYKVFNDLLEMSAITISNQVDPIHYEEREQRYLELIKSYDKEHQQLFPLMFFHLIEAMEEKVQTTGPEDILGPVLHHFELHNKYRAQYFTPQHISDCMAMISFDGDMPQIIDEKGFISMSEPTTGSGVMVTSMCKAMMKNGFNYCDQLVVTAVDCDLKCVHMTYLQLSLYGVPAVVIHGDSILCEEWSRWYTPVYIMNDWIWRAPCGITTGVNAVDEKIKCALEPTYSLLRKVEGLLTGNAYEYTVRPMEDAINAKARLLKPEAIPQKPKLKASKHEATKHLSLFEDVI